MQMNIKLSSENFNRLIRRIGNGEYASFESAANALIERALNSELPETVKYDSDRLAMGLGGKEQLNSVFALVLKEALQCAAGTAFNVSHIIDRLPKSVYETITPNMRRALGRMFHQHVANDHQFTRVDYSSPAKYKRNNPE